MFKEVNPHQNFPELEEETLQLWKKENIYHKTIENRKDNKLFRFYDGPPFATGLPHYGHILAMAIKDSVVRYKTMQGYKVPRKFGWDCHGLPVENLIEKELGISGKPDIEKMGIEKFNQACRDSVLRYTSEWGTTIDRMGRWGDDERYVTMDNDYIESIWWVFNQIWSKDLVYKGFKSMPYCPRCGTPLSNFETNLGYKDVVDISIYIKFLITNTLSKKIQSIIDNGKKISLLVWTTTPWTLSANSAIAVSNDLTYCAFESGNGEVLILLADRVQSLKMEGKVIATFQGEELVGTSYEPLYNVEELFTDKNVKNNSYKVYNADFITTTDGTGLVHIAPAFGEDDLKLGQKENIGILKTVDENGVLQYGVKEGIGKFVKDADKDVIKDLKDRKILYREEQVKHTYPFCWRCDSPLIYYAIDSWFISVSKIREKLIENNQQIHWVPEHIKNGRFGKWLEDARDWAVSRNRYWGAPVPIWECEKCNKHICVGSRHELEKLSGRNIDELDLHRPFIDKVELECTCGGKMKRVTEVLDCWFESGSMPYAQYHYPFNEKIDIDKHFPGDFIAEGLDQTRGWFYTLNVISTILFDKPAFYNCIVNGIIVAGDGKKLSKKLRNYEEPETIFNQQGADALRWFLLSSPAATGNTVRFSEQHVADTVRRVILPYWNVYSFFITYANVDKWTPKDLIKSNKELDKWIIARLNQTITFSTKSLEEYELPAALRVMEEFIKDLSTWYLRLTRKRRDKEFYSTMYNVLLNMAYLFAPFMPYISEEVYQNLKTSQMHSSIHLTDWPKSNEIDQETLDKMTKVRNIVEIAHALRKEAKIKVRQPLSEIQIFGVKSFDNELLDIVSQELNVKKTYITQQLEKGKEYLSKEEGNIVVLLNTQITDDLKEEGLLREIIRQIQFARKKAGYKAADKINLYWQTKSPIIKEIFVKYETQIVKNTICEKIYNDEVAEAKYSKNVDIDNNQLFLAIK